MELATWLQKDKENFPILGLESFDTFLKICSHFSEWALDDLALANRAEAYKIWVCHVKGDKIKDVKSVLERYASMKLLLYYYNINIVENNNVALYIKLDWEQNKWIFSYGITNNKKLYKVGEFDYALNVKLPENPILKYVLDQLDDFNPREHLTLYKIKQDMHGFNPGYCQILDPILNDKIITLTTMNLGNWVGGKLEQDEPMRLLDVFKEWVKEQSWWNLVTLIVRPGYNKTIDFIIKLK